MRRGNNIKGEIIILKLKQAILKHKQDKISTVTLRVIIVNNLLLKAVSVSIFRESSMLLPVLSAVHPTRSEASTRI